ncbi:MAG: DUF4149 domain-containing protein [Candidatus Hydrothermarchaeota archaeon]|jgi:uncharacterized membrane protein|nr:DUF4149 domain-containing protein [Candidatus Hydrothermarchaeota archaeon]
MHALQRDCLRFLGQGQKLQDVLCLQCLPVEIEVMNGMTLVVWLHITAAVVWLGGKIFTSLTLNPVLRMEATPEQRLELLASLGKRFKYLSWGSLAVLIITGVINVSQRVSGLDELLGSRFGTTLLAKVLIVVIMIAMSAGHSFFLTPRLRVNAQENDEGFRRTKKMVVLIARGNILLGVLVLLLAVML